jgi:hypothetical protein
MHHIFGRSEIIEAAIKGRNKAIMRTSEETVRRKRIKLHFRLRWWWIGLLLLLLWGIWRSDNTIYDEQQLIPVTCSYQEIISKGGYRAYVNYIVDSEQRWYRLNLDNIRPLRDALKTGDILIMKIEPSRSEFFLYDRRIAYLESNGNVFYSIDDYTAYKQEFVWQRHMIDRLIIVFLIISLVGMFISQNREIFYSLQRQRKRKKKRQQEEKRRLQKEALRLQQAEAQPLDPAQQRKLDKQSRQNKSKKHQKRRKH